MVACLHFGRVANLQNAMPNIFGITAKRREKQQEVIEGEREREGNAVHCTRRSAVEEAQKLLVNLVKFFPSPPFLPPEKRKIYKNQRGKWELIVNKLHDKRANPFLFIRENNEKIHGGTAVFSQIQHVKSYSHSLKLTTILTTYTYQNTILDVSFTLFPTYHIPLSK